MAHPVSVTQTFVYVTPEKMDVRVTGYLEDLVLLSGLKSEGDLLEPKAIQAALERHKKYVAEKFVVRDLAGEILVPDSVKASIDKPLPDEGVKVGETMGYKMIFELTYPLEDSPEFLTFNQFFTDEDAVIASEMSLDVQQQSGGKLLSTTLRLDTPETVRFNWDNPPLSEDASDKEREAWLKEQEEATLGITSYSSVYSFLYIEEDEVRLEILIPLLTLEPSILLAHDGDEFFTIAEQKAARVQVEAYFKGSTQVTINGEKAEAEVDRCDFFGLDFTDFARRAEPKTVPLNTARIGIILTYPTAKPPTDVTLKWNAFNRYVSTVSTVVFAGDKVSKTELSKLGKDKNIFQWQGNVVRPVPEIDPVTTQLEQETGFSIPVGSLVIFGAAVLVSLLFGFGSRVKLAVSFLAGGLIIAAACWPAMRYTTAPPGGSAVTAKKAGTIFEQVHRNVYAAFGYRDEEQVYDALAKSIAGDLLTDIYLQVQQQLVMEEQGGARSKIENVNYEAGELAGDSPTPEHFDYRSRWQVAGTVEHWGHIHQRTNEYEAKFSLDYVDDAWKITKVELLDEKTVGIETQLRRVN